MTKSVENNVELIGIAHKAIESLREKAVENNAQAAFDALNPSNNLCNAHSGARRGLYANMGEKHEQS